MKKLKFILTLGIILFLSLSITLTQFIFQAKKELETLLSEKNIENLESPFLDASIIFDQTQHQLMSIHQEKRYYLTLDQIPENIQKIFICSEDANFYSHHGISFSGILRAFLKNIFYQSHKQGGSTITQQLSRQWLLSSEKSYQRKIKEIIFAFNLEKKLSKEKILELYLNKIFLGRNNYGIASAAKFYFQKNADELTLNEITLLAGILPAPSRLNPLDHPEKANTKRIHVLNLLHERGLISTAQKEKLIAQKIILKINNNDDEQKNFFKDEIKNELLKNFTLSDLQKNGYKVYSSFHAKKHQLLKNKFQILFSEIRQMELEKNPDDFIEGAALILNSETGKVEATLGSHDYTLNQYNRSLKTYRPTKYMVLPMMISQNIFDVQKNILDFGFKIDPSSDGVLSNLYKIAALFSYHVHGKFYPEPSFINYLTTRSGELLWIDHPKTKTNTLPLDKNLPFLYEISSDKKNIWVAARLDHDVFAFWIGYEFSKSQFSTPIPELEKFLKYFSSQLNHKRYAKQKNVRHSTL